MGDGEMEEDGMEEDGMEDGEMEEEEGVEQLDELEEDVREGAVKMVSTSYYENAWGPLPHC